MTRVHAAVLSVVVLLATVAAPARSAQQPVFRAGVPTVSIYATVVDASGRLVPNLSQDDFEVYDNGRRQPVTVFANEVQPITLVMMLDRSQSVEQHFTLVRDAAEHFVTNLLPLDRVRIGSFSDRIQLDPQAFTSDKAELVRILRNNLQEAGGTPLWNATAVAMTALEREDGRRVVLVFTDGFDGPDFATRHTNVSLREVRERAAAEGVMIYAIGLATPCEAGNADFETSPRYEDRPRYEGSPRYEDGPRYDAAPQRRPGSVRLPGGVGSPLPRFPGLPGRGRPVPKGPGPFGLPPRSSDDDKPAERSEKGCSATKPDPNLRSLAHDGGGGYFELKSTDDLTATFARIADELHHQYLIAYTVPEFDGKMHSIDVRTKQGTLTVRARRTYQAK